MRLAALAVAAFAAAAQAQPYDLVLRNGRIVDRERAGGRLGKSAGPARGFPDGEREWTHRQFVVFPTTLPTMLLRTATLESGDLPPLQEAALLFAAGHAAPAREVIDSLLASPGGRGDTRARAMLAELAGAHVPMTPLVAPGTLALEGVVSASHPGLKALVAHAQARRAFAIDLGGVERIDFSFAGEFTALLRGFHAAGRRVIVVNCRELELALLEAMGAGRYVSFLRRPAPGTERAAA